jgi:hypothetical protein
MELQERPDEKDSALEDKNHRGTVTEFETADALVAAKICQKRMSTNGRTAGKPSG